MAHLCLQVEKEKRLQTEKIRIAMNKLKEARIKKVSFPSSWLLMAMIQCDVCAFLRKDFTYPISA